MRTKLLAPVFLVAVFMSSYTQANNYVENESYEVASLIINLAQSIARDLEAPVSNTERIVTKALVSEEGNSRIYFIEGKDVYSSGRAHSTYWLRLIKSINGGGTVATFGTNDVNEPSWGQVLPLETTKLIGPLLNSVYDIAQLNIEHRRVHIEHIIDIDLSTIQIIGINNICTHDDLNRFSLQLIRHRERNHSWYEILFEHPYSIELPPIDGGEPLPIDVPGGAVPPGTELPPIMMP